MLLNFTKVVLLSFGRKGTEGSAKFSASLTKHVIEKMGWGEAPDWQKESTPAGRLAATQIDPAKGWVSHTTPVAATNAAAAAGW